MKLIHNSYGKGRVRVGKVVMGVSPVGVDSQAQ